jgi:1-acyl-sn-glycerol-3-phosphate acyltransferase
MSLAYVSLGGLPMGRGLRERVAVRRCRLIPHLLSVLASGAVDVTVSWGEAVAYDMRADRKAIARDAERSVRRMTAAALRAAPPAPDSATPEPMQPLPEPV